MSQRMKHGTPLEYVRGRVPQPIRYAYEDAFRDAQRAGLRIEEHKLTNDAFVAAIMLEVCTWPPAYRLAMVQHRLRELEAVARGETTLAAILASPRPPGELGPVPGAIVREIAPGRQGNRRNRRA